jgi:hypothetical protein
VGIRGDASRHAGRLPDGFLGLTGCCGAQRTREAYDRNKLNYSSDAHILDISWEWHARAFMSGSKTFDEDFFITLAKLDLERKERQGMVPNSFGIMGDLMDRTLEFGKAGLDLTTSAMNATGVNTLANTALHATSEATSSATGSMWTMVCARFTVSHEVSARCAGLGRMESWHHAHRLRAA